MTSDCERCSRGLLEINYKARFFSAASISSWNVRRRGKGEKFWIKKVANDKGRIGI
jgi:hypothetical protein